MLQTSQKYKDYVYTRDYARYFRANILFKMVDVKAQQSQIFTWSDPTFYSFIDQLSDENFTGAFDFGTLEDYLFLLNGTKRIMPNGALPPAQYGVSSEALSGGEDEDNAFAVPPELDVFYGEDISTGGRTLYFDNTIDSVPRDFDILFYSRGTLVHTQEVRGNTNYLWYQIILTGMYDHVKYRFLATTLPYRRIHIIEDIPGIYMGFNDLKVVSMSYNQQIDIFNNSLIAGEVDFQIENQNKQIDILNPDGLAKYLQQRQPIDVQLEQVFPDDTTEAVKVVDAALTAWKINKGSMIASFTGRDKLDTLSLNEYIKGTFPSGPISMYDYAVQVLDDAKITGYTVDIRLKNIYTTAPLPVGTHKEVLRVIMQASQSVLTCDINGGLHVTYISPLRPSTNQVLNAVFDMDWTHWEHSGCELDPTQLYTGVQSVKMSAVGQISQPITGIPGHKIYCRFYVNPVTTAITGTEAGIYINDELVSANLVESNIAVGRWSMVSFIFEPELADQTFAFKNNSSEFNIDGLMYVDLTTTYGVGKEPDRIWCNENIRLFTNNALIPRYEMPAPTDSIKLDNLSDTPEIATEVSIDAIEANIYSYKDTSEESDVYKGTRVINGTEEFTIKYSALAKDCKIEVYSVDANGDPTATNTAKLVSSTLYAQAAVVRVTANTTVEVKVRGKAVKQNVTVFKLVNMALIDAVLPAETKQLDNVLITNKNLAEDIASYQLYWYNRGLEYNFDWRQNPAVELLDYVQVYDDFGVNNTIMITERNIDYNDGILNGSSKGVF